MQSDGDARGCVGKGVRANARPGIDAASASASALERRIEPREECPSLTRTIDIIAVARGADFEITLPLVEHILRAEADIDVATASGG